MTKIRFPLLTLSDKMRFGKHRGKTIKQIVDSDPSYLDWAEENVEGFILTLDARAARDRALLLNRSSKSKEDDYEEVDKFMKRRS